MLADAAHRINSIRGSQGSHRHIGLEVYDVLRRYNVAFCIHDFADMKVPKEITADFTYLRFHGPTSAKYWGSYSDRDLRGWADWITQHRRKLTSVYAYFNNDPEGAAVRNALTLKQFVNG